MSGGIEEDRSTRPVASSEAITAFLNRPQTISEIPIAAMPRVSSGARWNCGMRCEARTIGPATRWGKKLISRVMSSRLAGAVWRR